MFCNLFYLEVEPKIPLCFGRFLWDYYWKEYRVRNYN